MRKGWKETKSGRIPERRQPTGGGGASPACVLIKDPTQVCLFAGACVSGLRWQIDGETVADFFGGELQNHCRW